MAPDTVTIRHLAAGNTKQIKTGPWLICVVSLWSGGLGAAAVAGSKGGPVGEGGGRSAGVFHLLEKIRQKVIDFPMTCPTPQNTPLPSQTAGVVSTHTTAHTNTLLQPREPHPPPRGPVTTPPILLLAVSLSSAQLLIYVFAEQLLPRELREQHSHLSTLVTRCHLLLPAHRTSRQTMPRAF